MSDALRSFVSAITGWLDEAGVPYMLAGSFASTLHGRPRSTQAVDIVIDPTEQGLRAFLVAVPEERAYVGRRTAMSALYQRDMFNVIDIETGWKADLIIRGTRPFSAREFQRRRPVTWSGIDVVVASPEDTILSKLERSQRCGGSERQLEDVAGVAATLGLSLDREYIEHWVDTLKVRDEWSRVLRMLNDTVASVPSGEAWRNRVGP